MLPEKADELLRDYKANLGRCAFLEVMIAETKADIRYAEENAAEDLVSITPKLDGMPHGTSISNPTESAGMRLVLGYLPDDIPAHRAKLRAFEQEYHAKKAAVNLVEAFLLGLTSKERWMIERQIFDLMSYREINYAYREQFGEACSKDSLRRLKKDALAKIYETTTDAIFLG